MRNKLIAALSAAVLGLGLMSVGMVSSSASPAARPNGAHTIPHTFPYGMTWDATPKAEFFHSVTFPSVMRSETVDTAVAHVAMAAFDAGDPSRSAKVRVSAYDGYSMESPAGVGDFLGAQEVIVQDNRIGQVNLPKNTTTVTFELLAGGSAKAQISCDVELIWK